MSENQNSGLDHKEIRRRAERLQERMKGEGLELALILQNADLYYLSVTVMDATLAIPQAGEPSLFVRRGVERARGETPWEVVPFRSFREILPAMEEKGLNRPSRLGLELDVLPYALVQRIQAAFSGVEIADISPVLRSLRAVKSPYEADCLRRAAAMQEGLMAEVRKILRPGMTELELSAHLEFFLRRQGHHGIARMRGFNHEVLIGAVAAGENALRPSKMDSPCGGPGLSPATPFGAGEHRIQPGEPIVVDMLGTNAGYISDKTRMAVLGQPSEEVVRAHAAMLRAQEAALEALKPGAPWEEAYHAAVREAEGQGYGPYFMGMEGDRVHFVGHGVGLELDEYPLIAPGFTQPLEVGMAIALEPKVSFPGIGVVGVENTFLLTDHGPERITSMEDEIVVVEK